jgi:phosphatidylinositol glycan class O
MLVVDALRFDFIEPAHLPTGGGGLHHHGKVPFVAELLAKDPARARLATFVADPPTVTAQRLKGLTTGGLPTFLELRQNFASAVLEEDTWVAQLKRTGRRVGHLGDDTWEHLFPGAFSPSLPLESFNTRDLHSVDDAVRERLAAELTSRDWSILVRHTETNTEEHTTGHSLVN